MADAQRTATQLRAQRPVLEWLLQQAGVKTADSLETGHSTPTLLPSPAFDEEEHIGITPAVDDKCFIDPPPEYSPPSGSSSPVAREKADIKQESQSPAQTPKPFDSDSLFNAVNADDTGTLSQLLLLGADASTPFGELRRTSLHIAAHLNHVQSLALLLKSGAVELSTEDAKGDTALHLAAWSGNVEALSLLLSHSAEVDFLSGRDGYSPLWCAISANQIDAARLLLKHGARVSLRSAGGGGLMPLHQAAVMGQSAMCELLLERGAQVDCLDDDKNTPLHYASASGSVASVRVLLRGGASLEAKQSYGLTAVHWAAHKGHAEVIEVLLSCGAEVDSRANEGATPLHLAANRGHVAAAKMLFEKGASRRPGSATWDGVSGTPAEMAKSKGHNRLVRLFRS
ncbi:Putative ankyrin repeat-containing domain superfamily [Septoria linicola]|uniref:Ankyrin repeat-containing domain superfamily n=1 Tax=Septoria linicola TaxID=215465 RepID=A0A9Q9AK97_9PEZI|nr:putative ankyrin repeat-containing domain superfamily [Septoria linicola]USW48473.1 Putative ankyrin repeat-containing domain superfamily [Septoria linicola]